MFRSVSAEMTLRVPEDFEPQDANVQLSLTAPLEEVEAELNRLHDADKSAERSKAKLKPWLWVTGIATFLGFIIVVTLPFAIPLIILAVMYHRANKQDVEDRRLDTARHLLATLRDEFDPKANVVLAMDFRAFSRTPGRSEGPMTLYSQQWLRLGVVLANGSALQIAATTHSKRKSRRKRKYTKHKDKITETLTLELHPPKGRPFDPALQGRIGRALAAPQPSLRLQRCRIKPRAAELTFVTDVAVRVTPRRPSFLGRTNLLDAHKVLSATTLGYRAMVRPAGTT